MAQNNTSFIAKDACSRADSRLDLNPPQGLSLQLARIQGEGNGDLAHVPPESSGRPITGTDLWNGVSVDQFVDRFQRLHLLQ